MQSGPRPSKYEKRTSFIFQSAWHENSLNHFFKCSLLILLRTIHLHLYFFNWLKIRPFLTIDLKLAFKICLHRIRRKRSTLFKKYRERTQVSTIKFFFFFTEQKNNICQKLICVWLHDNKMNIIINIIRNKNLEYVTENQTCMLASHTIVVD